MLHVRHRRAAAITVALVLGAAPATLTAAEPSASAGTDQAASDIAAEAAPVTREEIRAALRAAGGGPTEDDIVDPQAEILEKTDQGDHERWRMRYLVDDGDEVHAYLLLPKPLPTKETPRPLVMCPHPTWDAGKDLVIGIHEGPPKSEHEAHVRATRRTATDLVKRGFIVFAPDRAAYGERRLLPHDIRFREQMSAYNEHLAARYPDGWNLTLSKAPWDLQRALDFLVDFEFIDETRIGAAGHSLGAWDSLILMAFDDRIKAAVVNCGGSLDFRPEFWRDPAALRDYLNQPRKQSLRVNANLYLMLAAPRPVLYAWSVQDPHDKGGPHIDAALRDINAHYERVSNTSRRPEKADFTLLLHGHGHDFPPEAQALAYTWLEIRLGLHADAP